MELDTTTIIQDETVDYVITWVDTSINTDTNDDKREVIANHYVH